MAAITSTGNSTVKRIRALRHRKERERSGLFYVEGIRLVGEAADLAAEVELCVVAPELLTSEYGRQTVNRLVERGATHLEVSADVFRSTSLKDGPQGIAAVVRQHWTPLDEIEPGTELCWIALDAVQDPGNLGTILRTSDAVGAAGVILLGDSTDPFDPTTVRASMGAIFSQCLVRAGVRDLAAWKRRHGAFIVGTSDSAQLDYLAPEYPNPLILLMGSEREGLGGAEAALCDVMVRIPMVGRSDSLNLAVATGVMLYEFLRQRSEADQ
jgi:RNA methyltransferase, TrmH family